MKILYFHLPDNSQPMLMPVAVFMDKIKKDYDVIDIKTPKEDVFAMYEGLNSHWGSDNLIIIHQDNLPLRKHLTDLSYCNHIYCGIPCLQWREYNPNKELRLNVINGNDYNQKMEMPDSKSAFCDKLGTGFVKISKRAQLKKLEKKAFGQFDGIIWNAIKGFRQKWYLHYPIHLHLKAVWGNSQLLKIHHKEYIGIKT